MESKRKSQITMIAVLAVAVVALGVGFAAFNTALTISSSAEVTPDSSSFKVAFSADGSTTPESATVTATVRESTGEGDVVAEKGNTATIENGDGLSPKITGLHAEFTAPGQSVEYHFYVKNIGEYDAFLNSIDYLENAVKKSAAIVEEGGNKTLQYTTVERDTESSDPEINYAAAPKICSAGKDLSGNVTQNVDVACSLISVSITIGSGADQVAATESRTVAGDELAIGAVKEVVVTITYSSTGADALANKGRADGPFYVSFGDIKLDYNTVKGTGA